jgi:hypothetical protein
MARTARCGGLALALLIAVVGCAGSPAARYTVSNNPCVNSRMANGDWQEQGMNRVIPLHGAEMYCWYGPQFNSVADPSYGIGRNTSGWNEPKSWAAFPFHLAIPSPSATSQSPVAAPGPTSYPTPTAEASGPPGCPGSPALMAAWNAAPSSTLSAQQIGRIAISGFNGITCWDGWIVAYPIANANGYALFGQQGGLHMLTASEMKQFNDAVCSTASSPSDWKNPADGPATC